MRGKIPIRSRGGRKYKLKVRYLVVAMGLMLGGVMAGRAVEAAGCPDVRVVFARGSGGERWETDDYLTFKATIESKLATTNLSYEFIDLDYPAVGIDNISVLMGAYFGAGDAYEFGASVDAGVRSLANLVNGASCPGTQYVLGGYSQGAMMVSKALASLNADRVIYAATFGDPKLYLPEGKGAIPAACRGENLSDYRMYVPDCQAYKGMLGAYVPYEPLALEGKVGTWCNKRDIFCSSRLNIADHLAYVSENLYGDASLVIFDKICKHFGIENRVSSPHDTVVLIDSTSSMEPLIDQYKNEAKRLAERTLAIGGRVALYDYRDYQEGYEPRQRCSFETCTLETFMAGLNAIEADAGADVPESLLASSLHVMKELKWKQGSTKSMIILTDAGYHNPDYDVGRTTLPDVIRLSKQIDPVNVYVLTTPENTTADMLALTFGTGGTMLTTADDWSGLTDYIMARYDSLPRVEENDIPEESPILTVEDVTIEGSSVTVKFATTGTATVVALNDAVLGRTQNDAVTIGELDLSQENVATLVPLGDDVKGEPVEVRLDRGGFGEISAKNDSESTGENVDSSKFIPIPKVPNTGKH